MKTICISDIVQFGESIEKQRDNWVERNVLPTLQHLIDKAQARINKGIKFLSGNGTYGFYFYPGTKEIASLTEFEDKKLKDLDFRFTEAVGHQDTSIPICIRYRQRFPELVLFIDLVVALEDELDYVTDDIIPTNFKGPNKC